MACSLRENYHGNPKVFLTSTKAVLYLPPSFTVYLAQFPLTLSNHLKYSTRRNRNERAAGDTEHQRRISIE
jgi:hypothetical protein